MLWRPHSPVYPKLVTEAPGGLKRQAANALRKRGCELLPICRLAKNGYNGDLVETVREGFKEINLVRIDCKAVNRPDYKKIGAKLRDLVPCIVLSFQEDQILLWKGKEPKCKVKKELPAGEAGTVTCGNNDTAEELQAVEDTVAASRSLKTKINTVAASGNQDDEGQDWSEDETVASHADDVESGDENGSPGNQDDEGQDWSEDETVADDVLKMLMRMGVLMGHMWDARLRKWRLAERRARPSYNFHDIQMAQKNLPKCSSSRRIGGSIANDWG
ncbi:hypothetical protein L7F22_065287 [Adiantum nelumboides]|nr:hypothetical protein [Adiantum nelumboides]